MKHLVGLLFIVTSTGCTGGRLGAGSFLEQETPDGVQTPTGWLIRYYQDIDHKPAYDAALAIAKTNKWDVEDNEFNPLNSELELETLTGDEIEIKIWAAKDQPLQVGIQYDGSDRLVQSVEFFTAFEAKFPGKRIKPPKP